MSNIWFDHGFKMSDGQILTTDEMLQELYDYSECEVYNESFAVPIIDGEISNDIFLTVQYEPLVDDFVDTFGAPIFREGWIQDYNEWLLLYPGE